MNRTSQCAIAVLLVLAGKALGGGADVVTYVFDQQVDTLLRIQDKNNDGDTLDTGEVTRYMDSVFGAVLGLTNSQGLLALGPDEVLASDNFDPDNIVRMHDLNGDGDAFDAGEQNVYWSGMIGGGLTITNPVCISLGPGGALYAVDNNTLDGTRPCAVYKLADSNTDGDVEDAGEATTYFTISPVGGPAATVFDIEFDAAGAGYVLDISDPGQIESIDRINPGATARTEWLSSTQLLTLTGLLVFEGVYEMTYIPATDEIVAVGVDGQLDSRILALKDRNGSNTIDVANEIRILWNEDTNADGLSGIGLPKDLVYAPDGAITFMDAVTDRAYRLVDVSSDGDYNDLGESFIFYSSATAGGNGQPTAPLMLSCTVAIVPPPPACPGDANGDGAVDAADLSVLLANFGLPSAGPAFGDFNADGVCDSADLSVLLSQFGADCA